MFRYLETGPLLGSSIVKATSSTWIYVAGETYGDVKHLAQKIESYPIFQV